MYSYEGTYIACYLVQMIVNDKPVIYKFKYTQDQLSDTKHFILEWVKKGILALNNFKVKTTSAHASLDLH